MISSFKAPRVLKQTVTTASVALLAAAGLGFAASSATAAIEISDVGMAVTDTAGQPVRQAGAHPDVRFKFAVKRVDESDPGSIPVEQPHRVRLDLPTGLVGDPTAAPTCAESGLIAGESGTWAICPIGSQVGLARVDLGGGTGPHPVPVYNVAAPVGSPAMFAFNVLGAVVRLTAEVRPSDHGITINTSTISQGIAISGADVTLWGVPADRSHDAERYDGSGGFEPAPPASSQGARVPFLTVPTRCGGAPDTTTAQVDGWDSIGQFATASVSSDFDDQPFVWTGCDRLAFRPSVKVQTSSRQADAPTGLDVELEVPQSTAPDGLGTAHVRDVSMTLPNGMSVSPSSAAGLGACSLEQIGLGSNADPQCPSSAKLGSVEIETPVLDEPLRGDILLAQPDNNPFGSLLSVYLVAQGSGVTVKLAGRIDANDVTGQLVATFDNNPELPFSALRLRFDSGPQAALATPPTCGTYTTNTQLRSWASDSAVSVDSSMTIDQGCEPRGFAPGVRAGTVSSQAGASSPFSLTLVRPDRQQYLAGVETVLPPGLVARIRNVPPCPAAHGAAGTCGAEHQVGTTEVLAGPGTSPLPTRGKVFLTGPIGDAPYGLSIVVPTAGQAGPFDLGNVVVQARLYVDRADAHVTVKSDPLPTIVRGFPLRLQQVNVLIDRPDFMLNPTGCEPGSIKTVVTSTENASHGVVSPFNTSGCGDLVQDQALSLRFTGKGQTRPGGHPGVVARLTSPERGTNLRQAVVKLPLSVALDPDNAEALCKPEQREAKACPAASIVGSAKAQSILPSPLTGPVYFVEGTRKSSTGRVIKTLPKLWIPLSANGITIDVDADSEVDAGKRLITSFRNLPDAPISSFELNIDSGKKGILTIPPSRDGGTCDRDSSVEMQLTGQNRKVLDRQIVAAVDDCRLRVARGTASAKSVQLRLSGLSRGRVTVTGSNVKRTTRTIRSASRATVTAPLTSKARAQLRRTGRVRVSVSVRFAPTKGKAVVTRATVVAKR